MNIMLDMHMHDMHVWRMKLRHYLEQNDMTDAAFAERVGMSQSQISRLRREISRPSWEAVTAIEAATKGKVRAADFLPTTTQEVAS